MVYLTYIYYLALTSIIVFWVGNFCYQNGKVFISNYFPNQLDLGNRINRLLRIAYYFLNIGLTFYCLYTNRTIENFGMMIAEVSEMIGFILLVIGVLHFNNIIMISLLHKHFKN